MALNKDRPLVVCDVDEVIVHFTRGFEAFLGEQGLWLDPRSFALSGNVRRCDTGAELGPAEVSVLIGVFFRDWTARLEPVDGAIESLLEISRSAEVVLLSNLPHEAAEARRANLRSHGLSFPLVTNSGPKGPALHALVNGHRHEVVFIDDSPAFVTSAHDHVPHAHLVHFLHDHRFARYIEPLPFVSLTTGSWTEAGPHIVSLIGAGQRSD